MIYLYVEHRVNTDLRFQVIGYNEDTGMGTLKGSIGVTFERLITKEELEKRNYRLKRSETELPMGDWPAIAPLSIAKEPVYKPKEPPPPKMSAEEQTAANVRNSAAIQGATHPAVNPVAAAFGGEDDDE